MSLVASTGGISLVPQDAQNMLAPNVVARAVEGGTPTVDLALGYNQANALPLLRRLLSRADELVAEKPADLKPYRCTKRRKAGI